MKEDDERERGSGISERLTYLLIGGGIGAILALLLAPKSGYELRGDIMDATRKGIDRSREAAQQLGDRASEYYYYKSGGDYISGGAVVAPSPEESSLPDPPEVVGALPGDEDFPETVG